MFQTQRSVVALLAAASPLLLIAVDARAQTAACDRLKGGIENRIEATGVRGYSVEAVPSRTPTPSGAKVVGTCESGAYKFLYRRFGGSTQKAAAADERPAAAEDKAEPLSPPGKPPAAAPVERSKRPEPPRRAAPKPQSGAKNASPAASAASAATAATAASSPAVASAPAPASSLPEAPKPSAPVVLAVVAVADSTAVAAPPPASSSTSEAVVPVAAAAAAPIETPASEPAPTPDAEDSAPPKPGYFSGIWGAPWSLLLLPLLLWGLWAWWSHHRTYDKAGLPRGPRL